MEGISSMASGMAGALKFYIEQLRIDTRNLERNFGIRFEIQKRIRLLQLHPEVLQNMNYEFNMYIRGPYSRFLAEDYYNLDGIEAPIVLITEQASDYIQLVSNLPKSDLELLASIAQVMSYSRNASDAAIVRKVRDLKPKFDENEVRSALLKLKEIQGQFGLVL